MVRCGVDLVEVARVRAAIEAHGERLLARVFTAREIAYCAARRDPFPHYAARFALKEAFYKSIPYGHLAALVWKEAGLQHGPGGAPELELHGATRDQLHGWQFSVSVSHTRRLAIAQVLAQPPGVSLSLHDFE